MRHSWCVFFCLLQDFLENEDLGNSLGSVEALLEKHDDFEEAFTAQEEKITVRNGSWFGPWLHLCIYHIIYHLSLERITLVTIGHNIGIIIIFWLCTFFLFFYCSSSTVFSISPHPSPPLQNHPHLPPSILSPFSFIHVSFIYVLWLPFLPCPLLSPPTSPLFTVNVFFISMSLVIFPCLFVLLTSF